MFLMELWVWLMMSETESMLCAANRRHSTSLQSIDIVYRLDLFLNHVSNFLSEWSSSISRRFAWVVRDGVLSLHLDHFVGWTNFRDAKWLKLRFHSDSKVIAVFSTNSLFILFGVGCCFGTLVYLLLLLFTELNYSMLIILVWWRLAATNKVWVDDLIFHFELLKLLLFIICLGGTLLLDQLRLMMWLVVVYRTKISSTDETSWNRRVFLWAHHLRRLLLHSEDPLQE